ncbi:hypothetical protein ACSQ67_005312 [Phaseolus vulgaris]
MQVQELDYVMVPLGLLVLGMYHVWLLYTIICYPSRTVIGLNANSRYQWVLSIMAVRSIENNVSFLVAFLCNMQSIRYYAHVSFLITTHALKGKKDFTEYVAKTLNRGSYSWSLGLRIFYLSFPLVLWIYEAIPMFVCCCLTSFTLYFFGHHHPNHTRSSHQVLQ